MSAAKQQAHTHQQQPQRKGFAALSISCVSAAAAETATYPIDAIKTQLQLQYSSTSKLAAGQASSRAKPAGAIQLARQLLHAHGLPGLYAGLSPAVLRHFFYTGTRITLYEQLRTSYAAYQQQQQQQSGSSSSSAGSSASNELLPKLLFGLTAGAVGQLLAVPADLIKVQMQADVRAVMSGRQQQRQFSSIRSVASTLLQQQGVAGLWRGGLPAVQRAALVNLGELSTYDSAKQAISQAGVVPDGLPTHLAASICSGLVSALISTPADVVKTRLMAQAVVQQQHKQQGLAAAQQPPAATTTRAPTSTNPHSSRSYSSYSHRGPAGCSASTGGSNKPSARQSGVGRSTPCSATGQTSDLLPATQSAAAQGAGAGTGCRQANCVAPPTLAPVGYRHQECKPAVFGGLQGSRMCSSSVTGVAAGSGMPHYRGMLDCALQTVRQEGPLALYKGFWPTWARLGPWQLVFWATYEQLRAAAHISGF